MGRLRYNILVVKVPWRPAMSLSSFFQWTSMEQSAKKLPQQHKLALGESWFGVTEFRSPYSYSLTPQHQETKMRLRLSSRFWTITLYLVNDALNRSQILWITRNPLKSPCAVLPWVRRSLLVPDYSGILILYWRFVICCARYWPWFITRSVSSRFFARFEWWSSASTDASRLLHEAENVAVLLCSSMVFIRLWGCLRATGGEVLLVFIAVVFRLGKEGSAGPGLQLSWFACLFLNELKGDGRLVLNGSRLCAWGKRGFLALDSWCSCSRTLVLAWLASNGKLVLVGRMSLDVYRDVSDETLAVIMFLDTCGGVADGKLAENAFLFLRADRGEHDFG